MMSADVVKGNEVPAAGVDLQPNHQLQCIRTRRGFAPCFNITDECSQPGYFGAPRIERMLKHGSEPFIDMVKAYFIT